MTELPLTLPLHTCSDLANKVLQVAFRLGRGSLASAAGMGPKLQETCLGVPEKAQDTCGISAKHANCVLVTPIIIPTLAKCFAPSNTHTSNYSENHEDQASSIEFILEDNANRSPDNP